MADDERAMLAREIAIIGKHYVGGEASKIADRAAAQLRDDDERIKALEAEVRSLLNICYKQADMIRKSTRCIGDPQTAVRERQGEE